MAFRKNQPCKHGKFLLLEQLSSKVLKTFGVNTNHLFITDLRIVSRSVLRVSVLSKVLSKDELQIYSINDFLGLVVF